MTTQTHKAWRAFVSILQAVAFAAWATGHTHNPATGGACWRGEVGFQRFSTARYGQPWVFDCCDLAHWVDLP